MIETEYARGVKETRAKQSASGWSRKPHGDLELFERTVSDYNIRNRRGLSSKRLAVSQFGKGVNTLIIHPL